jgi:single-strand DNA-binding protein
MSNLNFNKVILGGRLTADPELRVTTQGTPVTSFNIAINRKGNKEITDFITCVAWRNTAEFIGKYFRKGSSIVVDGSIEVRSYEDKQGNKRQAVEVIVQDAYFVDSKGDVEGFTPPRFETPEAPNFEEVAGDDDLPF